MLSPSPYRLLISSTLAMDDSIFSLPTLSLEILKPPIPQLEHVHLYTNKIHHNTLHYNTSHYNISHYNTSHCSTLQQAFAYTYIHYIINSLCFRLGNKRNCEDMKTWSQFPSALRDCNEHTISNTCALSNHLPIMSVRGFRMFSSTSFLHSTSSERWNIN